MIIRTASILWSIILHVNWRLRQLRYLNNIWLLQTSSNRSACSGTVLQGRTDVSRNSMIMLTCCSRRRTMKMPIIILSLLGTFRILRRECWNAAINMAWTAWMRNSLILLQRCSNLRVTMRILQIGWRWHRNWQI